MYGKAPVNPRALFVKYTCMEDRMKKRAVIVFFVSLAIFLGIYFGAGEFLGSFNTDEAEIKGNELGENNTIEQNIPDEFLFVLLGIDKEVSSTDHQRSDTIMVCKVNFNTANVDILSVPRDTKVRLNGETHKINAAHAYEGAKGSLKALRDLLGIDIDYYAEINFQFVEDIVNAMGGVEVDSPVEVNIPSIKVHIPKGKSKLNGLEALQYVRARHPFGGSDDARIENQHYFIKTLLDQIVSPANIPKLPKMVNVFKSEVKTNIPLGDLTAYLTKLPNFSSEKIHSYILPGEYMDDGISWYIADKDESSEIVDRLFAEYKLEDRTTNEDKKDQESQDQEQ